MVGIAEMRIALTATFMGLGESYRRNSGTALVGIIQYIDQAPVWKWSSKGSVSYLAHRKPLVLYRSGMDHNTG